MKKDRINFSSVAIIGYILVLIFILVLPHYKYQVNYKTVFVLSLPLWCIFVGLYPEILKKNVDVLVALLAIAIIKIVVNPLMSITNAVNWSLITYLCVFSYFIFEMLATRKNKFEVMIVTCCLVIIFSYIAIVTYIELGNTPGVARLLAYGTTENEEINAFRDSNIGGFGFAYAIGMLCPYLAICAMRFSGKIRIVFIVVWTMALIFCITAQYSTLVFLVSTFSTFVFTRYLKNKMWRLCIIISIILLCLMLPTFLLAIAEKTEYTILASHFYDFANFLKGNEMASGRGDMYWNLFTMFLQNPIWGADLSVPANLYVINHSHSTFWGLLAGSGVIVTSLFYFIHHRIYQKICFHIHNVQDYLTIYVMLYVLSIVNPITSFELYVVVMLLIPLTEILIEFLTNPTSSIVKSN